jgi:hypothetical protein
MVISMRLAVLSINKMPLPREAPPPGLAASKKQCRATM